MNRRFGLSTFSRLLAAVYFGLWIWDAALMVGKTGSCEPISAQAPVSILIVLLIPFLLGLGARSDG